MDIDLGSSIKFNVKFDGNVYEMREPTVGEMMALKDLASDDHSKIVDFLALLGMPKSATESMPIRSVKALVDGIVGAISEKK